MMSRVGIELTNFINPDLTWKTVSKGYRTGTRRSRKQVTNNWKVGAELVDSSGKMVEDAETTVSESEKLGVAVLGRRFGDKIEQVPIKKRRFMFRSPSPPPRSCVPSFEESGQLVNSQHSRSQSRTKSTTRKQLKTSAASTIKFAHTTDFSGIEILADAACSNSIGDDALIAKGSLAEESKRDVIDSSTSGVPPQEARAPSDTANCSQKYIIHEEREDNTVACLQNNPSDMDDGTVKKSASLRDDRLHWDLNVSMDAWEQPPEIEEDMPQISECCESQKEDTKHNMGSAGNSAVGSVGACDVSEDINMKSFVPEICKSNTEINKLEFCSGVDKKYGISAPASGDHAQESSAEVAENVKASIQVFRKDACADQHLCPLLEDITSLQVEDSKISIIVEQKPEVDDKQKDGHDASGFKLDNDQVMNRDVASTCEFVTGKVACMTDSSILNEVSEGPGKMLGLDARNSQGSCSPSPVAVEPVHKSEELGVVSPSVKSEGVSALGAPAGEGQHGATVDSNGHEDKVGVLNADKVDSLHCIADKVDSPHCIESSSVGVPGDDACNKNGYSSTSNPNKVSLDVQPVGGFDSDVCQDAKVRSISMENDEQDGYDSQFEDGELRETDLCWNNDDGEAEFLDYGSDNGEAFDNDVADYSVAISGKVEVGLECDKEGTCVSQSDMEKKMKSDNSDLNAVSDHLIENGQCSKDALMESGWSEMVAYPTSGITEGGTIKKPSADCVDKLDVTDIPTRATGSKSSRKELQPSTTGSHLSPVRRGRSDNLDDSYPRVERERPALHLRSRSPIGGRSFNPSGGFRDSKRGQSPTYYGSYNSGRTRPKGVVEGRGYVIASDNAISDGLDNRVRRPFINSSSTGVYRPYVRRRSPSEREDAPYMGPVRDISPDRRKFRRFPQSGINRGFREEYHRQLPEENSEYSNRFRMTRRQRSISPPCGRAPPPHYPQPFKKSRSRSRSRSPIGWLLPRNRNEGPRHRSRSPEFRSKGRIERTRVPFQRPGFEPGYEVELMSPPRNRFSPPRNSRWFDDRNGDLRGRRSPPVRMMRPGQRFDSVRPMRRMNSSDDGFRPPPMMHTAGRYGDVYPGAGRGRKYEGGDDERRKNGERYEVINRVRRFDSDGPVRRFRYDTEDCFLAKNSNYNYDDCNRISEKRPRDVLPRRGSEEKDQQPRSNQDQQPRSNQEQQPKSNQEQQDQQPRMTQDQQPRLNQDNKVNNTSPKSLALLEGEAA